MKIKSLLLAMGCLVVASQAIAAQNTAAVPVKSFHYADNHRPQYHFSPQANWMNDPNGMVYFQGEYHLFFQYYPDGTKWGPMHWGHAISNDLVHWEEYPVAIYPDENGWIFSGSAVFDVNNTSGLGTAENPPLVAIFTYHNDVEARKHNPNFQTQGVAYSLDKGRTWTPYAKNPVLIGPNIPDFRDPKVSWYEPEKKWIMTLAVQNHVSFYSSKDLLSWKHESDFGLDFGVHAGVWECPDLIRIPVQNSKDNKYILLVSINPGGPNGGSATQYFVGDFDGTEFKLDAQMRRQVAKTSALFPAGKVFESFEGGLGNWDVTGNGFSIGAIPTNSLSVKGITSFQGNNQLGSLANGDSGTGRMLSKTFVIDFPYINFLVGGGNIPEKLSVNLLVDGKPVLSASGTSSNKINMVSWDVNTYKNKPAQIEIVDNATEGWGHIDVDQFVFAKEAAHVEIEHTNWLDYGTDDYAGVTWSNIQDGDGRRLFLGWMNNWDYANEVPTDAWRGAMTIPRELRLYKKTEGYRVSSVPVAELNSLRTKSFSRRASVVESSINLSELAHLDSGLFELDLNILANSSKQIKLDIGNNLNEKVSLILDRASNQLILDRTQAGKSRFHKGFASKQFAPIDGKAKSYKLQVYQDASSIEVFVNNGETTMTALVYPNEAYTHVALSTDARIELAQWSIYQLDSIWRK